MKFKEALDKALIQWLKDEKGVDAVSVELKDESSVAGTCSDMYIDHDTTVWYVTAGNALEAGKRRYVVEWESTADFLIRLEDVEV